VIAIILLNKLWFVLFDQAMSQRIYKPLMAHWITRQQWQEAAITSGVHHTGGVMP